MKISANPLAIAHDPQRLVREVTRKTRDESQSRQILHRLVNPIQKLRERGLAPIAVIVVIVIDRLPQQRHFAHAGVGQSFDFVDNIPRRTMNLRPARVGNDAVGAEFIAAAGDADVGLRDIVVGGDAARKIEQFEVSSAASSVPERRTAAPISAICRSRLPASPVTTAL